MERLNITYSVQKNEFVHELSKLISSAELILDRSYSEALDRACDLLLEDNKEGTIGEIARARDMLADADNRLHDVMNMIIQLVQHEQKSVQQPPVVEEPPTEQLDKVQQRMEEVKRNIKDLGIEMPEEDMAKIMGRLNDQASRGV